MVDEGIIELRAIRDDMVTLQGRAAEGKDLKVILYRLSGAIMTLTHHIEQLEKKANGR